MEFEKVALVGDHVRLEPLTENHLDGLRRAISDGELWKLFFTLVPHPKNINDFYSGACQMHASGSGLAFATIDQSSNEVVGSTRFMNANLPNKCVEIGFTFIRASSQKTKINTEAKLLMLTHAFESLKLNRVEFLTDYLNTRSRNAILRLGSKQEGILRSHKIMPDGRVRDSVLFSIIGNEWAGIKQGLEYKLSQ